MTNFNELLKYIDPDCSYDEWLKVGMALKQEGASVDDWDTWSRQGSKYHVGECESKWNSFNSSGVTGGTLYHIAKNHGYTEPDIRTDYDITNLILDEVIVRPEFVSTERVPPLPANYSPKGDMLEYLKTLFRDDDHIGYCVNFLLDDQGKWKPTNTQYVRTAGQIISMIESQGIEMALGTPNPEAGAYVRFNPLDGQGENNANVTRWKYCLIESDEIDIERQYSLIKAMNLPVEFLIHSGGKSLHAIVKVDAENPQQYRQRTQEVYSFCEKSGLKPDQADKNESRFSRLPGIKRGEHWQYIVARQIGTKSYDDWIQWRQDQADDLPPSESLADVWDDLPPLKEELIGGVLRVGHKLLLAGPSKASKSFLLMNLAVSIAEGTDWLGFHVRRGRVCYINLELDQPSCFKRFKDIYDRRGLPPTNLKNIEVWNLRGHSVPMNRLTSVLVHRFKSQQFEAVIIDPIYKVITGDENNATEMSQFCSYFDRIAEELGVATIYCHHHSKGASGKYANAADRSSGSGVFARDPDAILDLRELNVDSSIEARYRSAYPDAGDVLTAWELSATLREFAPMPDRRIWFDYPIHRFDDENILSMATYADSAASGVGLGKQQKSAEDWVNTLTDLIEAAKMVNDDCVTVEQTETSERNIKRHCDASSPFELATLDGVKVIHYRAENQISYQGKTYVRGQHGNIVKWKERNHW